MMVLDSFKLDDKVALVTGASAGLGQAIAIALAEAGADVSCHGNTRAPDSTCEAIKKLGRQTIAVTGDLSKRETPKTLIEETINHFGRLDILVNNAGTIRRAPATEYSEEDWATVIEVNLSSVFRMAQLAGRHMIERGGGKILNIASLLSFQGGITVPAYAASKGGVAQLTKALANEWAAKRSTSMRSRRVTCAPTTRAPCNRTRRATARYSNAFPPSVGASHLTWAGPRCSSVQRPAIIYMAM